MDEVWVFIEGRLGRIETVSLELLGKGLELSQALKGRLASLWIGSKPEGTADEAIAYGSERVYLIEEPRLEIYQSEVYASLMANLITKYEPKVVLFGATSIGSDLAPRVAAKVETGLTAHCVELCIEEYNGIPCLIQVIPGFGGNLMVKLVCPERRPQMATIRPGVMEKAIRDASRKGEIVWVTPDIKQEWFRANVIEVVEEEPSGTALEEAEVIVAGGWGLYSSGGFEPVEELAKVLGGEVAGTRPAVDRGWIPEDRMIGQSGKSVSPRLFISVGASGATHFTTGFLKSKAILAIDQNPEAPIFEVCDIGIVGDLKKILPCLLKELTEASRC